MATPPVDPYLGNIYEIPFGLSGMIAHENRWLAQKSELLVAENVTFANDVLQKDPAFVVYDPIGVEAGLYAMAAISTASGNWQGAMNIGFGYTGTPVLVKNLVSPGQTSPWTFTVGATVAAGLTLIISLYQPSAFATVTDSQGNTYLLTAGGLVGGSAPSDPSVDVSQFTGFIATQLTNGVDTITVTWTGGATNPQLIAAIYPTTGAMVENATATATTVTTFICPNTSPAGVVALRSYLYPLMVVGGAFIDKDTATATVTGQFGFTKFATANRAGVGQLVQLYKLLVPEPAIAAQIDWNSQALTGAVAGTVTVTQGITTIQGAGTAFLTAFRKNDEIIINNEVQTVNTITSNGTLDTYSTWAQATAAGQTAIRRAGPSIVTSAYISQGSGPGGGVIYKEANGGFMPGQGILAGVVLFPDSIWTRTGRFVIAGKESAGQSRKLFYFDGIHCPIFLADDGATMTAIPTPPPDWSATTDASKEPINGVVHQGALFAWGNLNDPHRIYRSTSADHTKFVNSTGTDDAGQYPIASSIGERLWGGAEYQGVLFLWKYPRGIFYFDDTDPNFLNWTYHIRSEALGCAPSPHSVLPIDDDVIFCAPDAHFHLLSAVSDLGGVRTSDITRLLGLHRWTREHIDIPSLKQLCSAYNPYTKTAFFGVRSRSAVTQDNDLLLKFDFGQVARGGAVRFSYSTAFRPNALSIRRSASVGSPKDGTPLLFIGEISTSMLEVLDDGSTGTKLTHGYRNDPIRQSRLISTSYPVTASLPRLDFADVDPMNRQRKKNYDSIEFIFGENDISDLSGQTITFRIMVDGNLKQTITLTNITATRVMRQLRCGDGYDWQILISTSSVVSAASATPVLVPDVVINGLQVYWRPGSQDHAGVMT